MASLKANEISISILSKYIHWVEIFSNDLVAKIPEYIKNKNHVVNLIKDQYLFYKPIYHLKSVELKTLKTYIIINWANNFIRLSKSSINTFILFIKKPNDNLYLYINYHSFYILTIKNRYYLPLIGKYLD